MPILKSKYRITFFVLLLAIVCKGQSQNDTTLFRNNGSFSIDSLFQTATEFSLDTPKTLGKKHVLFYFHFQSSNTCNPNEKHFFYQHPLDSLIQSRFYPIEITPKDKIFKSLSHKFSIAAMPVIIITDSMLNMQHKFSGKFNSERVKKTISDFIYEGKGLYLYKKKFEDGEKTLRFLRDYCYLLRDANMLDSAMILNVMNKIPINQINEPDNMRFVQEFIYYRLNPFIPINHPICIYYYKNQSEFEKYFSHEQVKSNAIWMAINQAARACKFRDEKLFNHSINILEKEPYKNYSAYINLNKDTIGRITSPDVVLTLKMSFFHASQKSSYLNKVTSAIKKRYWNDWKALNEFAWTVYQEQNKDSILVYNAIEWIQQSIKLKRNSYNIDTYASLLFIAGDYENALNQANEALAIAKSEGLITKNILALINKIKNRKTDAN